MRGFVDELKSNINQLKHDAGLRLALRKGMRPKSVQDGPLPVEFDFYVSSEKGLFQVGPSGILRLSSIPMYGVALTDSHVYMAGQIHKRSVVLRGETIGHEPLNMRNPSILYETMAQGYNERIHQINHGMGSIWVANTGRNSILQIDPASGEVTTEIWPFTDDFSQKIIADQNHINSVHAYGDFIVFTAYTAGDGSLIGVIDHDMNVTGFRHENMGIHDIYLEPGNFYFCDTFGDRDSEFGGTLITRDGPYAPDIFEKPPGYITRGLVKSGNQLVIGHSHKGTRSQRFKGNGSLLLFNDDVFHSEIQMPCAQIYQMVRSDGLNFDESNKCMKLPEAIGMFTEHLGSPVFSKKADCTNYREPSEGLQGRLWRMPYG